jgi:hypothetical protein
MPGTTLLTKTRVGPRVRTLYTRIGDALGWACLVMATFLIYLSRSKRRAASAQDPLA